MLTIGASRCERKFNNGWRDKVAPLYFNGNGADGGDQAEALTISTWSIPPCAQARLVVERKAFHPMSAPGRGRLRAV